MYIMVASLEVLMNFLTCFIGFCFIASVSIKGIDPDKKVRGTIRIRK